MKVRVIYESEVTQTIKLTTDTEAQALGLETTIFRLKIVLHK